MQKLGTGCMYIKDIYIYIFSDQYTTSNIFKKRETTIRQELGSTGCRNVYILLYIYIIKYIYIYIYTHKYIY